MSESAAFRNSGGYLRRAFAALITPSHRKVVAEVARAGETGRSFSALLLLGSKQPTLSQQLATLCAAQLLARQTRARGAAYRLGPIQSHLNRWFESLNLTDDLVSERAKREHIALQPLFGCLGLPLCRAIVVELSGSGGSTGVQLSRALAISAPRRSRMIARMSEAGLIVASSEHPYISYALQQEAAWRAWDWVYDLAPLA